MGSVTPASGRSRSLVIGVCALALLAFGISRLGRLVRVPPQPAPDQLCHQNLSFIVQAMTRYAADSGGAFPAAAKWHDVLCPKYLEDKPVPCPERPNTDCGYAFNAALAGITRDAVAQPDRVIVVFESDGGWDAAGGPELLPKQPRHRGGDLYALLNGDVVWRRRGDTSGLQWQPELKTAER